MRRDDDPRMPGFAAEASLCEPAGAYRLLRGDGHVAAAAAVTPQALPEFLCRAACWFCDNLGWCDACNKCYGLNL